MTTGEMPSNTPGEAPSDPYTLILDNCVMQVQQTVDDLPRKFVLGESIDQPSSITPILIDMAIDAAREGSVSDAEEYVASLLYLSDHKINEANVKPLYLATRMDSQPSRTFLHKKLAEEKKKTAKIFTQSRPENRYDYMDSSSTKLRNVAEVCEALGESAEEWIETYAINDEHRWKLYTDHYKRLDQKEGRNTELYQQLLNDKATELLDGTYESDFQSFATWYMLKTVKDPEIKTRLLARFKETTELEGKASPSFASFNRLSSIGEAMLDDETLQSGENIEFFTRHLETSAQKLRDSGIEPFHLMRARLRWDLALKRESDQATPEELIDFLDLRIGEMMSEGSPSDNDDESDVTNPQSKLRIALTRDGMLFTYARDNAEKGNLADAREFIASINNGTQQVQSLAMCLSYAATPDQVNALKPDEMALSFYPELALQFSVKETLVGGEPESQAELASDLAQTMSAEDAYTKSTYITQLYHAIADRNQRLGLEVAYDTLGRLRDNTVDLTVTSYLSEVLIRAGSTREVSERYQEIMVHAYNDSDRQYHLWQLAKLLNSVG